MKEIKKSRKNLILLTSGFPFGNGETFIENEIPYLASSFEKVFILVPEKVILQEKRPVPKNTFIITTPWSFGWLLRIKALSSREFWEGLFLDLRRENLKTGFFNVFRNCWHYFAHALKVKKALKNAVIKQGLKSENTILYSYWFDHKALGTILLKNENPTIKTICRAHRWDIYEESHPIPFLPFRPWLGETLDRIVFISNQGMDYFQGKFPEVKTEKLLLSYLGTLSLNSNRTQENSKEFSIVSCSSLIPRKRVDLIARAILELKFPVNWTHIGDGPEMENIKMLAKKIENRGGKVRLVGNLPNQAVRNFYKQNYTDLFISTSDSEGLPVSMMEAQSAGIPILSTDVGGVNEIVINGITGWLLGPELVAAEVAEKIKKIYELQEAEKQKISDNAFKHWQKNFNAEKNFAAFVNLLQNL